MVGKSIYINQEGSHSVRKLEFFLRHLRKNKDIIGFGRDQQPGKFPVLPYTYVLILGVALLLVLFHQVNFLSTGVEQVFEDTFFKTV